MKFIRFGDSLLNLEHVTFISFHMDQVVAWLNGGDENYVVEKHVSEESAQARFKELSDYLVDEKHLTTKSGDKPNARVMTIDQAAELPDIIGKKVIIRGVFSQADGTGLPLKIDFNDFDYTWLSRKAIIEVID